MDKSFSAFGQQGLWPARAVVKRRSVLAAGASDLDLVVPAVYERPFMFHRVAISALLLIGIALVALAMVWPQGQGAVSPGPFARPLIAPERMVTIAGQPITTLRGPATAESRPTQP